MKKVLLFAALTALVASCSNGSYTVTVTMPTSETDGKMAYLANFDTQDTIDSVKVANKCFRFEGSTDTDVMARILVGGQGRMLVLEPGDVTMDWSEGKASGTVLNDVFTNMVSTMDSIQDEIMQGITDYNAGKIDSVMCQSLIDSLNNEYSNVYKSGFTNYGENSIGFWAFTSYAVREELSLSQIEEALKSLPARISSSVRVKGIVENARNREKTAEGQMFVDFTVVDENGKEQKLSDYVGKGDYVLVDFWASWCGPCRREMPVIKSVYDKYAGKGLTVLGVAVWDEPADTQKAIKELELPWPQITNAQKIPSDIYGFNGIPHIILFGPDGTILARGLYGEKLIAKVDEVMVAKK